MLSFSIASLAQHLYSYCLFLAYVKVLEEYCYPHFLDGEIKEHNVKPTVYSHEVRL